MKNLLIAIFLLLNSINALAIESNGSKTKGTDQAVLEKLTPLPGQDDVSKYTKIQILFNVPLDSGQIKKHDIKLTYLTSQTNDHIDGAIAYSDNLLTFTPDAPLEPGVYEVEIKSLKAEKAYKDSLIKEIKYRFTIVNEILQNIVIQPDLLDLKEGTSVSLKAIGQYDIGTEKDITNMVTWHVNDTSLAAVDTDGLLTAKQEGMTTLGASLGTIQVKQKLTIYKEINGHRLPPEPDPAVNNSTLLGIDSNNDGVRDDVERWTIQTYQDKHPIVTAIGLQGAKAAQIIIQNPENAKDTMKYFNAAVDCAGYFQFDADINNEPLLLDHYIFGKEFKNIQFNTVKRSRSFGLYNANLSGGVYKEPSSSEARSSCEFNITEMLKD